MPGRMSKDMSKKVSDQIECLRECQKICRKKISGWMADRLSEDRSNRMSACGVKEKQTRYLTASGGDHSKKVYFFYLCLSPFTELVFRWKSRLETHGFTRAAHAHYRGFKADLPLRVRGCKADLPFQVSSGNLLGPGSPRLVNWRAVFYSKSCSLCHGISGRDLLALAACIGA